VRSTPVTIPLALLISLASCGGPTPTAPATPSSAEAGAPSAEAGLAVTAASGEDDAELVVSRGGAPIGRETWRARRAPDGTLRYDVEATLTSKGNALQAKGSLVYGGPLEPRTASLVMSLGGQEVGLELGPTPAGPLALVTRPKDGKEQVLTAGGPVSVFSPSPLNVGYAPLCIDKPALDKPAIGKPGTDLTAFPGLAFTRVSESTLVAVVDGAKRSLRGLVFDQGGVLRVELACDGDKLVLVRLPLESVVAVRKGYEKAAEMLAESAVRRKPALPESLVEIERKVPSSGGAVLACSYLAPRSAVPSKSPPAIRIPAVILLTGSGPQDRDEDTPGPGGLKLAIFKTLAIRLAEEGVASLRCDDRGVGASTGDFAAATLDTFVSDASAMVASLRSDGITDPARVGVVGHSEGAVTAPIVAGRDGRVKAMVLMAAPARPLGEIGLLQARRMLEQLGVTGAEAQREMDKQQAVVDAIRTGKPLPEGVRPDERAAIERQRPWLLSHFKNDPRKLFAALRPLPILVAQGGKDIQVPPEDAEAIKKLAAKNPKVTVKVYPELNHLFARARTGNVSEYADPAATIDETFLDDVARFAAGAL